jgi:hypothetical protein
MKLDQEWKLAFKTSRLDSSFPQVQTINCRADSLARIYFDCLLSLSTVAGELFPIMVSSSEGNSIAGITFGFIVGIIVVFGLEKVVGYLENLPANTFELIPMGDGEDSATVVSYMHGGGYCIPFVGVTVGFFSFSMQCIMSIR